MSSYSPAYIVEEKEFEKLQNQRKRKKTIVKKPKPLLKEGHENKILRKPLASGITAHARLIRFQKKMNKKRKKPSSTEESLTKPIQNKTFLDGFVFKIRSKVEDLLNYIEKNIAPTTFSWDKNTLEISIVGQPLPKTNFKDIINYLFGVGEKWQTSYSADEFTGTSKEFASLLRAIPRGANDFFFILKEQEEDATRLFGFHLPYILNLLDYEFLVIRSAEGGEIDRPLLTRLKQFEKEGMQDEKEHAEMFKHYLKKTKEEEEKELLDKKEEEEDDVFATPAKTPKGESPTKKVESPTKKLETNKEALIKYNLREMGKVPERFLSPGKSPASRSYLKQMRGKFFKENVIH
jgi:hypothetical protein